MSVNSYSEQTPIRCYLCDYAETDSKILKKLKKSIICTRIICEYIIRVNVCFQLCHRSNIAFMFAFQPLMGIPPNPWTQRAFLEALEAYYAQRRVRAKKQQTPTKKRKESRVTQKNEETLPIVHFVPNDQSIT